MPLVPVKCTSCGGDIQLDDSRENGFCIYCGSKVVFRDAIQKMELSGSVSVKGIADLEKLLQNAETFRKLGDTKKTYKILKETTEKYPEDYRTWWSLALIGINAPYDRSKNIFLEMNEYHLNQFRPLFDLQRAVMRIHYNLIDIEYGFEKIIIGAMKSAISLAPPEKIPEMRKSVKEWHMSFLPFYQNEIQKLTKWQEDFRDYYRDLKEIRERAERAANKAYQSRFFFSNKDFKWYQEFCLEKEIKKASFSIEEVKKGDPFNYGFNSYYPTLYNGEWDQHRMSLWFDGLKELTNIIKEFEDEGT